jgi:hypothetical protein
MKYAQSKEKKVGQSTSGGYPNVGTMTPPPGPCAPGYEMVLDSETGNWICQKKEDK